jgi:glycosyltransferase involved in cell wall biosynthesis
MGLSVILITKNEEANLKDCLESVSFANEIIIVDSQSTDQTISIAQSFGAKVEITPDWPGFGPQKNLALDLATQDWVLSIDADERVTPELKARYQRAYHTHFQLWRDQAARHRALFARIPAEPPFLEAMQAEALPSGAIELG